MSADSAVTYSFVHSEARSWSIPSKDPYEEAAQQLFEQAPHSLEYVPRDHVPVFVLEFEHPEDLVPAEDEAHASLLPPGFLSPQLGFPRLIHRLRIGHYLLFLDLGVRSKRVLLLLRDGQDPLWLMELIAKDRAAVRAKIETREALARSEAYCRALEVRVTVLETHARQLEWQRQAADDLAV
nr:hypothetical protein [Tanacetum cinerariifolium]